MNWIGTTNLRVGTIVLTFDKIVRPAKTESYKFNKYFFALSLENRFIFERALIKQFSLAIFSKSKDPSESATISLVGMSVSAARFLMVFFTVRTAMAVSYEEWEWSGKEEELNLSEQSNEHVDCSTQQL